MAKIRTNVDTRHLEELCIQNARIVSGSVSAAIVYNSGQVAIGEGDDGALWVLVHDPEKRPRGRNPGVLVELGEVSYEQNGLIRIINRRVARDSLERLVAELTGSTESISYQTGQTSRIPEGEYRGITVIHVDEHYRVHADQPAARHLADMQPLGPGSWLVMASEESSLRRVLVEMLMPVHIRLAWLATIHCEKVLIVVGVFMALLSFITSGAAVLALAAVAGVGVFRWKRSAISAFAHQTLVSPYIDKTFEADGGDRKVQLKSKHAA